MSTQQYYAVNTDTLVPAPTDKSGTVTSSGTILTGTSTLFTTELNIGAWVWNVSEREVRKVVSINSDTELELSSPFTSELSDIELKVVTAEDAKVMYLTISNTGGSDTTINGELFKDGATEEFGNMENVSGDNSKFVRPIHVNGSTSSCTVNLTMFSSAMQNYTAAAAPPSAYNSYLQAVIDQAVIDGVTAPPSGTLESISDVLDTITNTELAKMEQLFIFKYAAGYDDFKSYNIIDPTNVGTNVGVTFGANGINTGGSVGTYFNTNKVLSSMSITNTNHAIGFMYVGSVTTGDYRCMGCFKSGTPVMKSEIYPYSGVRTTNFLPLQDQSAAFHTFTRGTGTGNNVYHMKVDGNGASAYTAFENASLGMTKTQSSATIPALSMYLLAQNYDGTIVWKPSPNTCGAYYIGANTIDEDLVNTGLQLL